MSPDEERRGTALGSPILCARFGKDVFLGALQCITTRIPRTGLLLEFAMELLPEADRRALILADL
jgi:hypothetical protein